MRLSFLFLKAPRGSLRLKNVTQLLPTWNRVSDPPGPAPCSVPSPLIAFLRGRLLILREAVYTSPLQRIFIFFWTELTALSPSHITAAHTSVENLRRFIIFLFYAVN